MQPTAPSGSQQKHAELASKFSFLLRDASKLSFRSIVIFYYIVISGLYSISIVDFDVSIGLRAHPFSYQLPEYAEYLYGGLINIFIPHLLGIVHSKYEYYAFSISTTIIAFYIIYKFCIEEFEEKHTRIIFFLCIMSTPIPIVLLQYTGSNSAFVTIFSVLLILCQKDIYKFLFGILLVLAHKEQGALVAFGYIFLSYIIDEKKILSRENIFIITAVFIGIFINYLYTKTGDFRITRSRMDWVTIYGPGFMRTFVSGFPLLTLFSGIGLWVALFIKYIIDNINCNLRICAIIIYFFSVSIVSSLTMDYTRVACILLIPMFLLVTRKLCSNNLEKPLNSSIGVSLAIMFSLFHYQVFIYGESGRLVVQDTAWVRYPWLF